MKRKLISLYALVAITVAMAFIRPREERTYYIAVPERLIDPYYRLVQGGGDQLTVGQLKELQGVIMPQIERQYQVYFKEDSTKRKDSLNKKPW